MQTPSSTQETQQLEDDEVVLHLDRHQNDNVVAQLPTYSTYSPHTIPFSTTLIDQSTRHPSAFQKPRRSSPSTRQTNKSTHAKKKRSTLSSLLSADLNASTNSDERDADISTQSSLALHLNPTCLIKKFTQHFLLTLTLCDPSNILFLFSTDRLQIGKPLTPGLEKLSTVPQSGDTEDGDLIIRVGDFINNRYIVTQLLGSGTFGLVVKCEDLHHPTHCVALKVIKNRRAYRKQAEMEVGILDMLSTKTNVEDVHIIRMYEHFDHNNHLCISFELLGINLYELIVQNRYRGFKMIIISTIIKQILESLILLHENQIIHCDLKPENVLLASSLTSSSSNTEQSESNGLIKLIDFGSACYQSHTPFSYIQSRFYRSPEVLFGIVYTSAIDMWSLGCVAAELFLGLPIFPGHSQHNQIFRMIDVLGKPPKYMIENGKHSMKYFKPVYKEKGILGYELKTEEEYCKEFGGTPQECKRYFEHSKLEDLILNYDQPDTSVAQREAFIDFLRGCFIWDPRERWTPDQAIEHPIIQNPNLSEFNGPWQPKMPRIKKDIPLHGMATPHTPFSFSTTITSVMPSLGASPGQNRYFDQSMYNISPGSSGTNKLYAHGSPSFPYQVPSMTSSSSIGYAPMWQGSLGSTGSGVGGHTMGYSPSFFPQIISNSPINSQHNFYSGSYPMNNRYMGNEFSNMGVSPNFYNNQSYGESRFQPRSYHQSHHSGSISSQSGEPAVSQVHELNQDSSTSHYSRPRSKSYHGNYHRGGNRRNAGDRGRHRRSSIQKSSLSIRDQRGKPSENENSKLREEDWDESQLFS